MPKSKEQKKKILENVVNKINRATSIFFTQFNKLTVAESSALRKELRQENSEYYIAKKTLVDLAFKDRKLDGLDVKKLDGQIAMVFGYGDQVAPARIIAQFKKELEDKLDFVGGVLDNKFISAQEACTLASLPSRQELYAKIAGSLNAPISGLVNALAGNLRNLVYVLNNIKDKKSTN